MKEKLIFLDIDGTLTIGGGTTPPDSALRAIRSAQSRGHRVFLSSGRNMGLLRSFLPYGFDGVISCAGGYVECGGQVLFDCPMAPGQLETALDVFHDNGVFCTIEARDQNFGDTGLEDYFRQPREKDEEIRQWRTALAQRLGIAPMTAYDGQPIYKIVYMCSQSQQLDAPRQVLEGDFQFCGQTLSYSGCVNGELINRKFHKGTGVELVCRHLGVSLADTYAFGDSRNDWEMLKTVGFGVAMGNADPALKAQADYVCPPVTEDGLAQAFQTLGLSENFG